MEDAASFFSVLADEARLAMLWLLFNREEICVCDFMEALGITQSKASRHLRILYNAGLVTDRREGLWKYYALRPIKEASLAAQMQTLRSTLASRTNATMLLRRLSEVIRKREEGQPCCDR